MTHNPHVRLAVSAICLILAAVSPASAAWKEKVLYSFQGGNDGQTPAGGVVFDNAGNLYGVTNEGGSTCPSPGCGTIFQLSPGSGGTWKETVLYGFDGTTGSFPAGSVIMDANNNLYGTAAYGGSGTCILLGGNVGCGVVYELSPPQQKGGTWTYSVLYNFQGGNDGRYPLGNLALDKAGSAYGATWYGGGRGDSCNPYYGGNCGTVFRLSPKKKGGLWTEDILHRFAGVANGQQVGDGADPNGGLVLDSKGAIYGTTYYGGNANGECGTVGCGSVFRVTPSRKKGAPWSAKILYRFNGPDGANPDGGVILDQNGNLFGAAYAGAYRGYGGIFCLNHPSSKSQAWREALLYLFTDGNDGAYPHAGLIFNTQGDLYGTAAETGGSSGSGGNVFRLKPPKKKGGAWSFGVLNIFTGSQNGKYPAAALVSDKAGSLYSTTRLGGTGACQGGCGTVFEVQP